MGQSTDAQRPKSSPSSRSRACCSRIRVSSHWLHWLIGGSLQAAVWFPNFVSPAMRSRSTLPIGSIVVPSWGLYLGSYKVIPARKCPKHRLMRELELEKHRLGCVQPNFPIPRSFKQHGAKTQDPCSPYWILLRRNRLTGIRWPCRSQGTRVRTPVFGAQTIYVLSRKL